MHNRLRTVGLYRDLGSGFGFLLVPSMKIIPINWWISNFLSKLINCVIELGIANFCLGQGEKKLLISRSSRYKDLIIGYVGTKIFFQFSGLNKMWFTKYLEGCLKCKNILLAYIEMW